MSYKVEKDINRIPELIKIVEDLGRTEIHIGIFGSDDAFVLMYANVNEFGCTIKPKGKRLAIPLCKQAKEKSPREFSDLYTIKAKNGRDGEKESLYLVRNKGADKIEFMYWLATEVTIPERSFIRGGFDAKENLFGKQATTLLKKVLAFEMTTDDFFETLGSYIVSEFQRYLNDLKEPHNAPITTYAKQKSNPLVDTGRLREAITYKVVKK